mmetsp:Transcript_28689/g.67995  ORF Transcript_28689/g.67995 Transcript_28689/m.67995 type:complete len:209 (-) Transcript_28689:288-914(-)
MRWKTTMWAMLQSGTRIRMRWRRRSSDGRANPCARTPDRVSRRSRHRDVRRDAVVGTQQGVATQSRALFQNIPHRRCVPRAHVPRAEPQTACGGGACVQGDGRRVRGEQRSAQPSAVGREEDVDELAALRRDERALRQRRRSHARRQRQLLLDRPRGAPQGRVHKPRAHRGPWSPHVGIASVRQKLACHEGVHQVQNREAFQPERTDR